MKTNDPVITPNGPGIYQFPVWGQGQVLAAVSHKATAKIDFNKCQGCYGDGKGMWFLCTYKLDEVSQS